jgi:hypothetical protein
MRVAVTATLSVLAAWGSFPGKAAGQEDYESRSFVEEGVATEVRTPDGRLLVSVANRTLRHMHAYFCGQRHIAPCRTFEDYEIEIYINADATAFWFFEKNDGQKGTLGTFACSYQTRAGNETVRRGLRCAAETERHLGP